MIWCLIGALLYILLGFAFYGVTYYVVYSSAFFKFDINVKKMRWYSVVWPVYTFVLIGIFLTSWMECVAQERAKSKKRRPIR